MNRNIAYWYARGYFDGREFGEERSLSHLKQDEEALRKAYRDGYMSGAFDYIALREGFEPAAPFNPSAEEA